MNEWELAAIVLAGAIVPCLAVCALAGASSALPAFEIASTIATSVLMVLSEGFQRQPFIDLAIYPRCAVGGRRPGLRTADGGGHMSASHVAATVLLIAGVALELLSALGLVAMREALDRLHYVGLASYGALLIGASILVRASFSLLGDKAIAVGILLTALSPILVHATARSLRTREHGDWREGIEQHVEETPR